MLEENFEEQKTVGELKITEYASRIVAGESIDLVLEGLPSGMKKAVEAEVQKEQNEAVNLPPQYKGLPAEIIEEIWTIPEYVDSEKTRREKECKTRILEEIRKKEFETEIKEEDKNLRRAEDIFKISQIKDELGIQPVSENENILEQSKNIESMSMEDFAVWLAEEARGKAKPISQVNTYDILTARPEFRQARIAMAFGDTEPQLKIYYENEQAIRKFKNDSELGVKSIEGVEYVPGNWDHYKIQYEKSNRKETHKGYITIDKNQVLTEFTPEVRNEIVERLRDGGYRGQVKFPVIGSRALFSYDNIVLHGNEFDDVDRGLEIVQSVLSDYNLKYDIPGRGIDVESADGKKTSYTDRIAQIVEQACKNQNVNVKDEIQRLNI